jgi:hypothetical protein
MLIPALRTERGCFPGRDLMDGVRSKQHRGHPQNPTLGPWDPWDPSKISALTWGHNDLIHALIFGHYLGRVLWRLKPLQAGPTLSVLRQRRAVVWPAALYL